MANPTPAPERGRDPGVDTDALTDDQLARLERMESLVSGLIDAVQRLYDAEEEPSDESEGADPELSHLPANVQPLADRLGDVEGTLRVVLTRLAMVGDVLAKTPTEIGYFAGPAAFTRLDALEEDIRAMVASHKQLTYALSAFAPLVGKYAQEAYEQLPKPRLDNEDYEGSGAE